ncbi:hypothetical protein KI387_033926, partial [Taxus chinensis]
VGLRKLLDVLAAKGLALPQTTDWDGLSMAGVVSTAAHGSSLWGKGGGIHEYVVGLTIVVPATTHQRYAKLIHLTEKDEALKAARVSLGVLGAISQVTFAVEKLFKRSVTLKLIDDSDLEESFVKFAKLHEFGLIYWYPSFSGVLHSIQDRVPVDAPGNGKLSEIPFRPATVQSVVQNRAVEELNNAKINTSNLCTSAKMQIEQGVKAGNGYFNDGKNFTGFPVVGFNHLIQTSSGCQIDPRSEKPDTCPWEGKDLESNDTICIWDTQVKGNFFYHTSIAIPLSRIAEAIRDLKRIRDMDPSALCTLDSYLGVQLRYFKKSEDYLAHKEDSVVVEFIYFRHRELGVPRWNGHAIDEIEQMVLQKYGGVPHWGKNRVYTFEGAAKRTVNLEKFLEVKKQFDPEGYFSSEWSDGVLGIGKGVQIWRDGCALDGLCVCKEDRHCAPEKGFVCRAGASSDSGFSPSRSVSQNRLSDSESVTRRPDEVYRKDSLLKPFFLFCDLVYPNEAVQTRCTHLYCKPCLAYVLSTTRACPYDGYLITDTDSKTLQEENPVLADAISRVTVHFLYHKSGCTWQGTLLESIAHGNGYQYGSSPVVCNRCGTQIVHRQVQEHAQNFPGT